MPREAPETQHGVRDLAALLVDHYSFDRTNLLAVSAVNGGAFDLVAADQGASFALFCGHSTG